MTTAGKVREAAQETEIRHLQQQIADGSAWAALVLAVKMRPVSAGELARAARTAQLPVGRRVKAFDACVDGYAVFHDARRRCAL